MPKPKPDSLERRPSVPVVLAALDDARMKLENAQALAGDQQLARAELDLARTAMLQASADVKGAEADIAAARAMVTEARVSLDRTVIRSPIDGVVIGRHVDVGQTIAASVQAPILFTIGDLRRMRLLAEVPEGEVGGVQRGIAGQLRHRVDRRTRIHGHRRRRTSVAAGRAGDRHQRGRDCDPGAGRSLELNSCCDQRDHLTGGHTSLRHHDTDRRSGHSFISTPATPTTSTQQPAGTMGVVTYIAVIDVDAASEDTPPGRTGNRDTGWFRADAGRANPEQFPHVRSVARLVRRRGYRPRRLSAGRTATRESGQARGRVSLEV